MGSVCLRIVGIVTVRFQSLSLMSGRKTSLTDVFVSGYEKALIYKLQLFESDF